jgi:hypothetical protein
MSQAVFANCLHLAVGHLSKLERGAERPKGPTLVLLHVIQRDAIYNYNAVGARVRHMPISAEAVLNALKKRA